MFRRKSGYFPVSGVDGYHTMMFSSSKDYGKFIKKSFSENIDYKKIWLFLMKKKYDSGSMFEIDAIILLPEKCITYCGTAMFKKEDFEWLTSIQEKSIEGITHARIKK